MKNITQSKNSTLRSKIINYNKLFAEKISRIFFIKFAIVILICSLNKANADTFTVLNLNDNGPGSIRQAIQDANNLPGTDIINFNAGVIGTIILVSALPDIIDPLTITGPGADVLSVSGNNNSRVFLITGGVTVNINNLTITGGNVAGNGGGIFVNGSFLNLNNSVVSNNSANVGAGLCILPGIFLGSATITNSTMSGNTATTIGGGIFAGSDGTSCVTLIITNSTISNNSSATGGGIAAYCPSFGPVTITNSTISNNSANANSGGGIFNQASVTLINSIVANSTGGDIVNVGGTTDAQYSLVEDGLGINGTSSNNLTGDPLLGPLANNGGTTFTHELLSGSSAIDKGSAVAGLTTDQRGLTRIKDFPSVANAAAGNGSDVGAFEVQCISDPIVINNNDAGAGSLRQAIIDACTGSNITFDPGVTGTITLASTLPVITKALTINGPGANVLTVSGNNTVQVFNIISSSAVSIIGLTIANGNDQSSFGGGAINAQGTGNLTVANCAFSNNTTNGFRGGAIYAFSSNFGQLLSISGSTFTGNSVLPSGGGGGAIGSGSTCIIVNCTFTGNSAKTIGGAIVLNNTSSITNCTITGNSVTGNGSGGGIYAHCCASYIISNSIIAGNTSAGVGPDISGVITSANNNILGIATASVSGFTDGVNGNQVGTVGSPINPLLGPLQDNGGPTFTMALLTNSPAIDKGSFVAGVTTDQRDSIRPYDNPSITNAAGGNGSDIGAFESQTVAPVLSINDVTQTEVNSGTSLFTFTVSLSAPAEAGGVTFDIATQNNSATTADNDYVLKSLTSQTIPAGSSTYTFDVTINGDITFEPDETFFVNVTNVTGATVSDGQGLGTIINDDCASGSQTFNYNGGVQDFVVPTGITFLTVAATGADGGDSSPGAAAFGGSGGVINATFPVLPGDNIRVIVGEAGKSTFSGGGGGGTAVINCGNPANCATGTLLLVAGGGGGGFSAGTPGGGASSIAGTGNGGVSIVGNGGGGGVNSPGSGLAFGGGQASKTSISSGGTGLSNGGKGFGGGGAKEVGFLFGGAGGGGYSGGKGTDGVTSTTGGSNFVDATAVSGFTNNGGTTGGSGGDNTNGVVTLSYSCNVCPTIAALSATQSSICQNANTTLNATGLASMGTIYGIEFKYFISPTTTPYVGGTTITTVANGSLGAGGTTASTITSFAIAGTYYVYAVLSPMSVDDACLPYATATTIVNQNPTPSISGSLSFCDGSSTILDAGKYFGYNWSTLSTSQTISVNTAGTFTVTVSDQNGCTGSTSVTTSINPNPTPTISGALSFCDGSSTTLDAGFYSGYAWSTLATSQTISVNTAGTFTVTVTDANGCTGSASITTVKNPNPVVSIKPEGSAAICEGKSIDLSSNNSRLHITYPKDTLFIAGTAFFGPSISITPVNGEIVYIQDVSLSFLGCSPYGAGSLIGKVALIDRGSCAFVTKVLNAQNAGATAVILANTFPGIVYMGGIPDPSITIPMISVSLADGLMIKNWIMSGIVSGHSEVESFSYLWSTGETTQSITTSLAGNYTLEITDANGCKGTGSTLINVNPTPEPIISGNTSFCPGGSTTLDAGAGYIYYLWSNGETTQTISVNTAATFTVTVVNTNGCTGSTSVTTILNPKPTASITGSSSFCNGKTTQLCANAGASSYLWSNNGTNQCITVTDANTYSVTITNQYGCSGSTSVTTIINPNPTPTISGNLSFCAGSSTTLNAGVYTGYLWSTLATTQTISINTAGTFSVKVTDANGCTGTTSVITSIKTYTIGAISGLDGVCAKQSGVVYCVTNPSPGILSYIWTLPTGASAIGATNGVCITLKFSSRFKGGSICVKAVTPCGNTQSLCKNIVLITKTPNTPGAISGPSSLCPNATATYSIIAVPNATSYLWSVPSNMQILSGQGSISVVVKALSNFNSGYVKVRAMNCKDGSGTKSMTLVKSRSCKESAKSIFESTIESDLLTGFSVYPNPTSGKLTITFISVSKTKVKLNIMDLVGKNILMNEVEAVEGTNTKQIDLTHLAKGMYFISFVIEGMKVQPFRIVVE